MLANGTKLEYKKKTGSESWTELTDLKEIPDCGVEGEKVDNTGLNDKNKQYDMGIGDLGDMKYKFKYKNDTETSPYRVLRKAQDDGEVLSFKETAPDGTTTEYDATVSVKRTGGGVNGVVDVEASMAVQSDLKIVDPV